MSSFKALLNHKKIEKKYVLQICDNSDLENGLLILTGLDLPKFVITELCECLKSSIDILELRLNQTLLQNDALNTIFRSLNCDLKVLNLEGIQLNNELIEEFSNVIAKNHSISSLFLHWTNLGQYPDSAKTFFVSLSQNDCLEELSMSNCGIMSSLAKSLAIIGLKPNISLRIIDLSWNKIGDQGAEALLNMLKVNKIIQKMIVQGNHISKVVETAIETQLIHNVDLHLKQSEMISKTKALNQELVFTKNKCHENLSKIRLDYEALEVKALNEHESLLFEIGRLEQQLKTRNQELGATIEKLSLTKTALEIAEEKIESLNQVDKARMQHFKDLQDECAAHEKSQFEQWNSREQELMSKCENANKVANEAKLESTKHIEAYKMELISSNELKSNIEKLNKEKQFLKEQNDQVMVDIKSKIKSLNEEHEKEIEFHQQELKQLLELEQSDKTHLQDKNEELKQKIEMLRKDHVKDKEILQKKHSKMTMDIIKDHNKEIEMLQTTITKLNDKEGVASNEYNDLKHSKNEIEIELKKSQIEIQECKYKINEFIQEKTHMENIIRLEFEKELQNASEIKDGFEKNQVLCEELKVHAEKLKDELEKSKSSFEAELKGFQQELKEKDDIIIRLRQDEHKRAQSLIEAVKLYIGNDNINISEVSKEDGATA